MDRTAETLKARIDTGFDQLKLDLSDFLGIAAASKEKIQQLEDQLNVHKLALEGLKARCAQLQQHEESHQALKESVKVTSLTLCVQALSTTQGFRIITLIDGDGAIFTDDLVSQGRQGGDKAARMLSDSIIQFLNENYGYNAYQLWVYVFYNKHGLASTLGFVDNSFDRFVLGFNQATRRFIMADVGDGKEAADTKIKAHLEDNIVLPQTFKIIFGGCHDNGYASDLRSHITAGFREKLILLKGYTQIAREIAALDLPELENADLFRAHKIGVGMRTVVDVDDASDAGATKSYSGALQRAVPREKSTRARSPSTETSCDGSYQGTESRHVNPDLRLSKQKPPPCTLFYLSNCKLGTECKYGHNYLLNEDHFEELRRNARLAPCQMVNRGELCTWGDACCYGHVCPHSSKCPFLKLGKCKFKGGDMHKDPAGA
ncbi:hypothetical protein C8F01DRAFT_592893 [Mycena amicta]|nr:hypothetical protein C8F01DRAFT_592893 [Mycena amicta]